MATPRRPSAYMIHNTGGGANPRRGAHVAAAKPPGHKAEMDQESHLSQARRNQAARILRSYEQLVFFSMQRHESVVQTRLHFEAILAGVEDPDADPDWPTDNSSLEEPKAAKEGAGKTGSANKGKNTAAGSAGRGGAGETPERRRGHRERDRDTVRTNWANLDWDG
ncbi:hypothetical protein MBLNU459_g8007t1 [Dothideomycetes sp. NU459]